MRTLILYYSYGGNTRRIAEMIRLRIGTISLKSKQLSLIPGITILS